MFPRIAWLVKLILQDREFYRVKKGQTLNGIALAFSVPARLIAAENGLQEEVRGGEILRIPARRGNLYTVRGGESKTLLCGGDEAFSEKNGTQWLYPTQKVVL